MMTMMSAGAAGNNYGYDDFGPQPMGEGLSGMLGNLASVVRQRKWLLIVPLIVATILSLALAFLLPATYRSKAVLLVQSSQLQTDNDGQVLNTEIDERVAKVRQQVLSRPDLISIIQELQLYPGKRNTKSMSQIVEGMRDAIQIEPVSAQLAQQRAGGSNQTIAFSMSYDYENAYLAQAVAQKLVERVLEVDSTTKTEQATDTVRFLTEKADATRLQMAQLESQITGMKARNGQVLGAAGGTIMSSSGSIETQIMMLERDNANLRTQRQTAQSGRDRDPAVVNAEAALAAVRATYTETHPDVIAAKARLEEAKKLAANNIKNLPLDAVTTQIESNNRAIALLRQQAAQERTMIAGQISKQAQAPVIQEQIAQLQSQLLGLNTQYQDTAKQLDAAKTAMIVETQQRGERLTLVDPPVVDDEPIWPNRWLVIGGGIGAGLALGLLMTFLAELLLRPLRGPFAAAAATGGELLGALPRIQMGPLAGLDDEGGSRWKFPWPRRNKMVEA